MKKSLNIYLACMSVSFVIGILFDSGRFTAITGFMFGCLNLIIGFFLSIAGIIMLASGSKEKGKIFMQASGMVLLTGGIACSVFPFRLN